MDSIEIKVSGLKEVQTALYSYSQQLGDKVVIAALMQGARLVQRQARANAPRKTGRLVRAIVVIKSKIHSPKRGGNKIGVYLSLRRGKGKKDPKDGFYGSFQEHGWKIVARFKGKYTDFKQRGRGRLTGLVIRRRASTISVPGKFFIRDALTSKVNDAINVIIQSAIAGAEIVKRKVGLT